MLENAEVKERFERVLTEAQRLASLKQGRHKINQDLFLLPSNRDFLESKGKTVQVERLRLETELSKLDEQERCIKRNVQDFFDALSTQLTKSNESRIRELISKRLRIRALLTEAVDIIEELEKLPNEWDRDMEVLKGMTKKIASETKDTYFLPESPIPAVFVPAPARSANESDKTSLILKHLASQIS